MEQQHATTRLIVFADDWGRHPSSCQHLTRHLLDRYPTLWVNTIGMRRPTLRWTDLGKINTRLRHWFGGGSGDWGLGSGNGDQPQVLSPRMWPGFRSTWQRRFNAWQMTKAVHGTLGCGGDGGQRPGCVAVTTIPIAADLVGRLSVDRWVYYCVDDFSVWPGLDGHVMQQMERLLVDKAETLVAASTTLQQRLAGMGRQAHLLTHGIDPDHWTMQSSGPVQTDRPGGESTVRPLPRWWPSSGRPVYLFWGLIDQRLDTGWCRALVQQLSGTLVLVGPTQSPDAALRSLDRVVIPGAVGYDELPALAAAADVLVMPYADLAVTRAMQPLKFKEYLATGRPVVARRLPATQPWSDAADVVETAQQFVERVRTRAADGTPDDQMRARRRLADETWQAKARQFELILTGQAA